MPIQALFIILFFLVGAYVVLMSLVGDSEKKTVHMKQAQKKKSQMSQLQVLNGLGSFNQPLLKALPKMHETMKHNLGQLATELDPCGMLFIKEIAVVFSVAVVIVLALDGPLAIGLPLLAFVAPNLVLKQKIAHRQFLILRTFPEIIDLMGLCLSAGLDFTASLKWITQGRFRFDNPFVDELKKLEEEILLGKSRIQALRDLDKRLDITEVSSLVRTLVIAEKMGVSVIESFERFSADVREQRFHRGERQARVASIKILFPLIFLILPVVGIIIMGPIIISFNQQGFMSTMGG